jgi:ribosomal protein L40E
VPVGGPASTAPQPGGPPQAGSRRTPTQWICPFCYLTNVAVAVTCRGCRSGHLHL